MIYVAVFPTDRMAERYARRVCLKLKDIGVISEDKLEDCVAKIREKYKGYIADIDKRWAEGVRATYGV